MVGLIFPCLMLFSIIFPGIDSNSYNDDMNIFLAKQGKKILPMERNNEPVKVEVSIHLHDIYTSDDSRLILVMDFSLAWTDTRLAFATNDSFPRTLHVPINEIWLPDIIPFNADRFVRDPLQNLAVLKDDGSITFVSRYYLETWCKLHKGQDSQNTECNVKFGSWVYDGLFVSLSSTFGSVDLSSYSENSEFDLTAANLTIVTEMYPCCPEPYQHALMSLSVKPREGAMMSSAPVAEKGYLLSSVLCVFVYLMSICLL